MAEKVMFGLKNVHYAVLTEGTTPSWATPVAVPGAVSISLSAEGSREPFYADDTTYFVATSNNGYSGDLEMALIPDEMLEDIWGISANNKGVAFEDATVEPKPFALLFEIQNDVTQTKYVMYRCFAERPQVASNTIEETKTPQTQTISISCLPVVNGPLDGKTMAKTTSSVDTTVDAGWYTAVYTG